MQTRLLGAVYHCLRPLVRILLSCGVGYPEFARLLKLAFLREAMNRQTASGAALNVSRISVSTGLSRKELARLRDEITLTEEMVADVPISCGARVMQLWHVDRRYIDEFGNPSLLPIESDVASFTSLVRLVGGDIPVGAVKSELLAAGAVEELPDGRLAARKRHFIPSDTGDEIVLGLTQILYPVLVGLVRNTQSKDQMPFLQRIAASQRLDAGSIPAFRKVARARAIEFLESVDDWISAKEAPPEASLEGDAPTCVVGVFYYEGALPDAIPPIEDAAQELES
jgi:hypothetical protein